MVTSVAQIIGVNGTNTPEVLTPEVRSYIVEMTVDTFGLVFRDDKYKGDNAPANELNNVIALSNEMRSAGKVLAVCFTLYTRDSNFNANNGIEDLDAFLGNGVYVYSIRGGNEEWAKQAGHGKKGGDFNAYWALCSQYLPALTQRGVDRLLIPVERPNEEQDTWNSAAASKINSDIRFQPDYHPYWGPKQAPVLDTLDRETLPVANPIQYLPFHDWFYMTLYEEVLTYDLIGAIKAWHEANIPTKEYHVTEFGPPTAVGHISNCMGFDATTDWFLNEWHDRLGDKAKFTARFNGPSPTGTAIINPRGKKDDVALPNYVKRLGYYTLYNYMRNTNAENTRYFDAAGVYTVSLQNMGYQPMDYKEVFSTSQEMRISGFSYTCLTADYFYDGSGAVEWWAKDSPKTYDVTGLVTVDNIPAVSYGYATVTVREAIQGCTDPLATNYNPQAEIDNGSCVVITPVCYRKRWLFSSLPCKPAKTNCNCK